VQEQEEPNPAAGRGEELQNVSEENIQTFSGDQKTDRLLNFESSSTL
jgi:hypothetical protein